MSDSEMKKRQKAIIVGGSISGLSCAHALTLAGWDVAVIEKSPAPSIGSPTGAGLGLDTLSRHVINSWINHPHLLQNTTLPLTIDQNQATDVDKKMLSRDEEFNFRAAYWADLHSLLYNALPLPSDIFLWGHVFLSFSVSADKNSVKVNAKKLHSEETVEIFGDLLVAADGCLSSIRRSFVPDAKPRYAGYCAWRGILDFSEEESSKKTIAAVREAYPDLGKCLYFDLACKTHAVLYELPNEKLNWVWYVNQPEPKLKGNSVTMKASEDMIQKMRIEAEKTWSPSLARAMKETRDPFVNVIYDCDPLERLVWDGVVVLVGDAAHPTTPHGLRSTNMSLLDAAVLGACVEKLGKEGLDCALEEYESVRLPVVALEVLHSRRMGRIKQGLVIDDREAFDPIDACAEDCEELKQNSMPFFGEVPLIVDFNLSSK